MWTLIWYGSFKVAALNQYKSTDCIACHTQKRTILSAIPFKWFWTNSASNMHWPYNGFWTVRYWLSQGYSDIIRHHSFPTLYLICQNNVEKQAAYYTYIIRGIQYIQMQHSDSQTPTPPPMLFQTFILEGGDLLPSILEQQQLFSHSSRLEYFLLFFGCSWTTGAALYSNFKAMLEKLQSPSILILLSVPGDL